MDKQSDKQVVRVQTRYKSNIHSWLAERAEKNNRSLNGELMDILLKAKEAETQVQATDKAA